MARKCDTSKYRKRRQREHVNSVARRRRQAEEKALFHKRQREAIAAAREAWLADPRRGKHFGLVGGAKSAKRGFCPSFLF